MADMRLALNPKKDGQRAGRAVASPEGSTLKICVIGLIAGSLLAAGTYCFLNAKRRARLEARANAAVADHVASAQAHLRQQKWEPAIEELQEAVAIKDSTNVAEAQESLTLARRRRAGAILAAAEASLGQRNASKSLELLELYLADLDALDQERAAELRAEFELAECATALLRQLPDESLARFAETGQLEELNRLDHPAMRSLYRQKLQAQLPQERVRRMELRRQREEELGRRAARIRPTPVFREVLEFVERTRRHQPKSESSWDNATLRQYVVRALRITDPAQEQRLFEDFGDRPHARQRLEEQISRLRASVKERFRGPAYREFEPADHEAFDWAVDRELDLLLQELQIR